MSRRLRIAVLGGGGMGGSHASALSNLRDQYELVAICDTSGDAAFAASQRASYDVVLYEDYASMLDEADLDAVVIAVPHSLHAWASIKALERGVHVICEKPGGLNQRELCEIELAAVEGRAKWVLGLNKRFYRPVEQAEAIIRSGQLGEVFNITVHDEWRHTAFHDLFATSREAGQPNWRAIQRHMGRLGAGDDTLYHSLSLLLALSMHQPYEIGYVDSRGNRPIYLDMEGPDTIDVRLNFGSQGRAIANCSWAMNRAGEPMFRVDGTQGQLVGRFVESASGRCLELEWAMYQNGGQSAIRTQRWADYSEIRLQAADFWQCVQYGKPSRNGFPHAHALADLREGICRHLGVGEAVAVS